MLEPQTYCYRTVEGCALQADVYRPVVCAAPAPVVLWIHGGALITGSRTWLGPHHAARLLGAGYIVVAIDYRLAPETKLPAIVDDVLAAYAWVRGAGPAAFGADPARIAVAGQSAGGYLTLLLGRHACPRPRALVSFYGYGDIVGDWYTAPDPFYCRQPMVSQTEALAAVGDAQLSEARWPEREPFYRYCRQRGLWPALVGGRSPTDDPAFFRRYCPADAPGADFPPTLLIHGDRDTDVPHAQSTLMAQRLAEAGVAHELLTLPGADHAFDASAAAPATQLAIDRMIAFLAAYLRSPDAPRI